ncbi:hypothetical protein BJ165DRAFT_1514257 [Panaeolus papilionaceus]|nr:hypothetical protein BJ165DRAFT_1514257 [Panaeolus papilionaceus]
MEDNMEKTYKNLYITGNIALKPVTKTPSLTMNILIMGPTGAGKSSFIEALCGDTSLGISKDQLEGYTQDVAAYQLINVMHRDQSPICIIDTPGFADRKISEMEIVTKINTFLKASMFRINYILFLTPITDIRISGSRRRTINTFKSLAGVSTADQITVVTTMWNQLHTDDAIKQANLRIKNLAISDAWKELIDRKTTIQKFLNTRSSALEILDAAVSKDSPYMFQMDKHQIEADGGYFENLVSDLNTRIQQLCYQETSLVEDLAQLKLEEESDPLLVSILEEKLEEVGRDLERFGRERTQLDGIKKRWEFDSLMERLPRQFNQYIYQLKEESRNHDWDTNQPFQPSPVPPDFLSLLPPTTPRTPPGDDHRSSSHTPAARPEPSSQSLVMISSLEERARELHKDLEQLKKELTKPTPTTHAPDSGRDRTSTSNTSRRKWLDSVKTWGETKLRKDNHT